MPVHPSACNPARAGAPAAPLIAPQPGFVPIDMLTGTVHAPAGRRNDGSFEALAVNPVRLARRAVTIPVYLVSGALAFVVTPFALPLLLLHDVVRRRRLALTRALLMLDLYLFCEVTGIFACLWIWLTKGSGDHERYMERNFALQRWWGRVLFKGGSFLFAMKMEMKGQACASEAPFFLFTRHVSVIDNMLPIALVSDPFAIRMRWLVNRSLLRDPCLDIVGNRLPNAFVKQGSGDSEREVRRVRELVRDMPETEAISLFPEGALFTPEKRVRVIERLREAGDERLYQAAEALQHHLPPRLGGALALLEERPGMDVVFCVHTGLEHSTIKREMALGGLVGRNLKVEVWRVPGDEIPRERDQQVGWLLGQWARMDAWVSAAQGLAAEAPDGPVTGTSMERVD